MPTTPVTCCRIGTAPCAWGFAELEIDAAALSWASWRWCGPLVCSATARCSTCRPSTRAHRDIPANMRDEAVVLALPVRRAGAREADAEGYEELVRHRVLEAGLHRHKAPASVPPCCSSACYYAPHAGEPPTPGPAARRARGRAPRRQPGATAPRPGARYAARRGGPCRRPRLGRRAAGPAQEQRRGPGRPHDEGGGTGGLAGLDLLPRTVNRYEPLFAHFCAHCATLRRCTSTRRRCSSRATWALSRRTPLGPLALRARRSRGVPSDGRPAQPVDGAGAVGHPHIDCTTASTACVALIPAHVDLQRNATFVLAVQSQMAAEALRALPTQVKIGPVEGIRDLVNLQLPGVTLTPMPVAPRQIPFHTGANYFELETQQRVVAAAGAVGGMAMHIAGDPGLDLYRAVAVMNAWRALFDSPLPLGESALVLRLLVVREQEPGCAPGGAPAQKKVEKERPCWLRPLRFATGDLRRDAVGVRCRTRYALRAALEQLQQSDDEAAVAARGTAATPPAPRRRRIQERTRQNGPSLRSAV